MKALKTKFKKGTALILSLALTVGQFRILPHKGIDVLAAEESTGNKPSVTAFATTSDLMNAFEADGTNETIGKIIFGRDSQRNPLEWYVLGKDSGIDGENIAIFAASSILKSQSLVEDVDKDRVGNHKEYKTSFGEYENEPEYIELNHYGASDLRMQLQEIAVDSDYFTAMEQSMMQATTIMTEDRWNVGAGYKTTDILYLLNGNELYGTNLRAGSGDEKILPEKYYWQSGTRFWLRTPGDSTLNGRIAWPYYNVQNNVISKDWCIRPATNLKLSSVFFASAAKAATSGTLESGEIAEGTAMTLRLYGYFNDIGTVTCDKTQGIILAKKSQTATGTVSVVIQGNDGGKDWYYSKEIRDKVAIKAAELKTGLGLQSDLTLSDCKIWIETTTDGVSYAKLATEGTVTTEELSDVDLDCLSVTAYATKNDLMNVFEADGTNSTIGKIVFGKDSEKHPLEWYLLGKDSHIEGDNTAIFAAEPIVKQQKFTEKLTQSSRAYEAAFGVYENNPAEVPLNHYGASMLRTTLQELAINPEYFTLAEQSVMQATTVTTKDIMASNSAGEIITYETSDVLYAVQGDLSEKKLWAGSGDEKILPMENYRKVEGISYLRTAKEEKNNNAWVLATANSITSDINTTTLYVENTASVQPATNLNLSSVLFASAVPAATSRMTYGMVENGTAMTLRMDGSNMDIGTVQYDAVHRVIVAKKSENATGTVSVVVQGNDGYKDWYYSKVIEDKVVIDGFDFWSGLGLTHDTQLSECKIWIETTVDNVKYAKLATRGTIAPEELTDTDLEYLGITTYATKDELLNVPIADGENEPISKIFFGTDSSNSPLEWYVLGKDSGILGENIAIFTAEPIATNQAFEDNNSDNKPYETSFGLYENNPKEVYPNHYGASDIRAVLQELAVNHNYFTVSEQSMMQATTITTNDTMNGVTYKTADTLYLLNGREDTSANAKYRYVALAGSGDDKILPFEYYKGNFEGGYFWSRMPVVKDSGYARMAGPETRECILYDGRVEVEEDVRPASNLNLSSVLYASAAVADTTGTVAKGIIAEGTAMTLRMDGSDTDIGSVVYDSAQGIVLAEKSATATGAVSVVIQGNDGYKDWYYSKLVTGKEVIKASDIEIQLGLLSDINLAGCKIWIETTVDNVSYAKVAAEGTITEEMMTTEPESSSKEEESTTEPESSSKEEESTTEPESSSKEEESTTEPESSSKEEESTTEPESSSKEEETTTEPESSNKEEESTTKPEQTKKEITITHVQLSGHTYTYDGTAKKPKVVVTVEGKKLVEGRDYKVTYLDNVNEGMATVTVTGQGGYKGKVARTFTIKQAKITSVSIASTSYSYNGRVKEPAVTVKSGTKKLIKGTDYTVSYKNNILPGVASVVVRGWRNYTGTITKTFNIAPSKVANFKQNTNYTTSKITMTWSRGKDVDGYAIYRSATKNGSYKYLKSVTATTYSNVGLKAGSKYYYKVRAYKTVNGKKIYGAYSDAKSMLTKPATPTGFTVALKSRTAKITWKKVSKAQGYEVYMTTSTYGSYKRIKNAGASTTSYNKTGLIKGKKYYFKMRAYTKTGTGAKVYSGYSEIKIVTVK